MLNLIRSLPPGAYVLDLGAGPGSFPDDRTDLLIVRLDLEIPHTFGTGSYVLGDAARLPFAAGVFDLIVSNHSLEHLPQLDAAIREIGRTVKPGGGVYVAVPDAGTLTDRIYRWLGRGGGHLNAFRSVQQVAKMVSLIAGLPLRRSAILFSSLSFLNSHNFVAPPPRRIALFAYGNERFLAFVMWILRGVDRRFGTRLSQYGWEFHFGTTGDAGEPEVWVNVCVRCGSGHSEAYLRGHTAIQRTAGLFPAYRCPQCGGFNLLSREVKPRA